MCHSSQRLIKDVQYTTYINVCKPGESWTHHVHILTIKLIILNCLFCKKKKINHMITYMTDKHYAHISSSVCSLQFELLGMDQIGKLVETGWQ